MESLERVYTVRRGDEVLGYLAIDTLIRGRSRGGLRLVQDLTEPEIRAAARSMTLKYGFLGMPHGGAKAGVHGDPEAPPEERRARLLAFAQEIEPMLRARAYLPDSDLGTGGTDIRWMLESVGVPVKRREWRGVDSGFYTAVSALGGAVAVSEFRGGSLAGARVAIEGFGSVGNALGGLMHARGAKVVAVSTSRGAVFEPKGLDVDKLRALAKEVGSRAVEEYGPTIPREELLELPVDVLAPCARYHSIDADNVSRVHAEVVCPGANNPMSDEAEEVLTARGVLCLPDFVTNCGGVLGGTLDFAGVARDRIGSFVGQHVWQCMRAMLDESVERKVTVREVAEEVAEQRFARTRKSAEKFSLIGGCVGLGLECYRRGWVPQALMAKLAPRYVRRLLGR